MQRGSRHSSDPSWIAGSSAMHTNEKNPEQCSILSCAMISRVKKNQSSVEHKSVSIMPSSYLKPSNAMKLL